MTKNTTLASDNIIPMSGPAWFDRASCWLKAHERSVLLAGAAFQLVVLVCMIALYALPLFVGETIRLKVEPRDPRDLWRGDYVTVSYEISRVPQGGIEGKPDAGRRSWSYDYYREAWLDQRIVYVTLEPDAAGKYWHATKASIHKPTSGRFIRGKYVRDWRGGRIDYGIEAYFVQEGRGRKLEDARRLSAEVALAPWGKATLRDLIIER